MANVGLPIQFLRETEWATAQTKSPPHNVRGASHLSIQRVVRSGYDDYALMAGAVRATGAASPAAKSKGKL